MRIAVTGSPNRILELKEKVTSKHELIEVKSNDFEGFDLILDLDFDDANEGISNYANLQGVPVVVSAVKEQLEATVAAYGKPIDCKLFGMNTLPGFINRSLAEMTSLKEEERESLETLFDQLDWPIKWVVSRVGMVTPRIIFMIINEAYYTVQEGTASKADIDIGMKLGTAYPKGPFEWVEEIGIQHVYEVLDALYKDTRDERYKICPMLKTEYLRNTVTA
ncbi:MAG: 3-hydroxyacyl-CoA dehydrogenase [Bacteroidia bacterium]|nr:3-hydroxyacyl-CoA dehydrogenase [Bacteroidia bacterium]